MRVRSHMSTNKYALSHYLTATCRWTRCGPLEHTVDAPIDACDLRAETADSIHDLIGDFAHTGLGDVGFSGMKPMRREVVGVLSNHALDSPPDAADKCKHGDPRCDDFPSDWHI